MSEPGDMDTSWVTYEDDRRDRDWVVWIAFGVVGAVIAAAFIATAVIIARGGA